MSTTYLLYLEAKIDNKWRCIDGYYKLPDSENEEKEVMKLAALYENGSRSYFGKTANKLEESGSYIPFSELSEEIKEAHPDLQYFSVFSDSEKKEACCLVVPAETIRKVTPKGYQYHGIYHKNTLALFDNDEIEELPDPENVDFKAMDPMEKQLYEYREWDSLYDWPHHFKKLCNMIDCEERKYCSAARIWDNLEMRVVMFVF